MTSDSMPGLEQSEIPEVDEYEVVYKRKHVLVASSKFRCDAQYEYEPVQGNGGSHDDSD